MTTAGFSGVTAAHRAGPPPAPFGRVLVAAVSPFTADGARVDTDAAARLAEHLVDAGCDGLVVSGTTGESPTTSDDEKERLLRAVVEAVGARAQVVAGVGTAHTGHSAALAAAAARAGAHGLLVVAPYYSRPTQAGVVAHVEAVAAAGGGLPVMLYDVPARTSLAFETGTLLRLAEHPQVVALKDAKGDLAATADVLAGSDLAVYSGSDELNLPLLALGGSGVVSVTGHVVAGALREQADLVEAGDLAAARPDALRLVAVQRLLFGRPAVETTKAVLRAAGLAVGPVRAPLLDLDDDETAALLERLAAVGVVHEVSGSLRG